jgi:hypothetical protein
VAKGMHSSKNTERKWFMHRDYCAETASVVATANAGVEILRCLEIEIYGNVVCKRDGAFAGFCGMMMKVFF